MVDGIMVFWDEKFDFFGQNFDFDLKFAYRGSTKVTFSSPWVYVTSSLYLHACWWIFEAVFLDYILKRGTVFLHGYFGVKEPPLCRWGSLNVLAPCCCCHCNMDQVLTMPNDQITSESKEAWSTNSFDGYLPSNLSCMHMLPKDDRAEFQN